MCLLVDFGVGIVFVGDCIKEWGSVGVGGGVLRVEVWVMVLLCLFGG